MSDRTLSDELYEWAWELLGDGDERRAAVAEGLRDRAIALEAEVAKLRLKAAEGVYVERRLAAVERERPTPEPTVATDRKVTPCPHTAKRLAKMGLVAFLRDQLEMWAGDPEDGGDADNVAYYAALRSRRYTCRCR